jgi:hypothetical protein
MHSRMFGRDQRGVSGRAPAEAAALAKQHPSQLMADELGRRAANAQTTDNAEVGNALAGSPPQSGAPQDGALRSRVSWQPVAAIVIPAVFVLIAFLVK